MGVPYCHMWSRRPEPRPRFRPAARAPGHVGLGVAHGHVHGKAPGQARRRWPRRGSSRCRGCCRWRCAYPAATPIRRRPCAGSRRRRPARPPRGPPLMRIAGTEGAASVKSDAFSQTATQRSAINDAAASTSSEDAMALPESTSASGMLGVITVARGNSWRTSASTAASAMSAEPTWPP